MAKKEEYMTDERWHELLAYAAVCFDNCTSPFETVHLIKKQVKGWECIDLSQRIAEIINDQLDFDIPNADKWAGVMRKAKADFEETQ